MAARAAGIGTSLQCTPRCGAFHCQHPGPQQFGRPAEKWGAPSDQSCMRDSPPLRAGRHATPRHFTRHGGPIEGRWVGSCPSRSCSPELRLFVCCCFFCSACVEKRFEGDLSKDSIRKIKQKKEKEKKNESCNLFLPIVGRVAVGVDWCFVWYMVWVWSETDVYEQEIIRYYYFWLLHPGDTWPPRAPLVLRRILCNFSKTQVVLHEPFWQPGADRQGV
jgi:hypothetical protein